MNLNQLKYFHTVCIYGSLVEAAECLYISQPSLSSAIKALEKEFGVALFNRRHSGMELTSEGKVLFEMSKDILSRADQLESTMKDIGKERSVLRLGVPPMIGSLVLPCIYRDFCVLHPEITLEIVEAGSNELLNLLSENYLDTILLLRNNAFDSKFDFQKIATLEIVCCASKENPITRHKYVTPDVLKNSPLVLFENSFFQTEKIKKWFADAEITPNIVFQTKQLSTMLAMISENVVTGFTFRQIAETSDAFAAIPTKEPIFAEVSLVWKKESYRMKSMENFRSFLSKSNLFDTKK